MIEKPLAAERETKTAKAVESSALFAWEVDINCMICIVFAATEKKANWIAVKSYWEAGYGRGRGTWPSVSTLRVPQHDNSRLKHEGRRAWGPEYVRNVALILITRTVY